MKRIQVSLIPICVLLIGCAIARPTNAVKSTEQEIRAALCELETNDFVNAQNSIRTVLKSEPENVYAHKILLGILTRAIKFGDSSAENKTRVKTAIDAYDQARNSAVFTPKEKTSIDRYLLFLLWILFGVLQRTKSECPHGPGQQITLLHNRHYWRK